jgi:single-strand DNA-binding protein
MPKLFGLDAELRFTNQSEPVATLSLAFSYGRKGDDGKRPTQWLKASFWGKRAESLAPYLLKGGLVAVTLDEVHIETFEGQNGPGYNLVGKVMDIELAGGNDRQQGESTQARPQSAPPRAPARPAPAAQKAAPADDGFDMDSEIPF